MKTCTELGWKVGEVFELISNYSKVHTVGHRFILARDDNSHLPYFTDYDDKEKEMPLRYAIFNSRLKKTLLTENNVSFNIGDDVIVLSNSMASSAIIGETYIIDKVAGGVLYISSAIDAYQWAVQRKDVKLVKQTPTTKGDDGMMNGIDVILKERGDNYGSFDGHAKISQDIKRAMKLSVNWYNLSDAQKEALEMVAHKLGRILNGNPKYKDSWTDIIGYTKLIEDTLED